jgi:hypothetical protein
MFQTGSGPGAHTTFYTVGTGSSPEVKRKVCDLDLSPASNAEIKERKEPLLLSMACSKLTFSFKLPIPCVFLLSPYQPTNALNIIKQNTNHTIRFTVSIPVGPISI